jgi:indole-3-glycerol phosphate synthase
MRGARRFSQAISEGDGISLLADVRGVEDARTAEAEGAEGVVLRDLIGGVREATELPILWFRHGALDDARVAGADACLLVVESVDDESGELEHLHAEALDLGFDCVVEVRDEDELRLALDRVDPEIFLLSARRADDGDRLEHVLGLLQDVPAGKLAVADLELPEPGAVGELERAGVDAVIVGASDVAELAGRVDSEA